MIKTLTEQNGAKNGDKIKRILFGSNLRLNRISSILILISRTEMFFPVLDTDDGLDTFSNISQQPFWPRSRKNQTRKIHIKCSQLIPIHNPLIAPSQMAFSMIDVETLNNKSFYQNVSSKPVFNVADFSQNFIFFHKRWLGFAIPYLPLSWIKLKDKLERRKKTTATCWGSSRFHFNLVWTDLRVQTKAL